MQKFAVNLTTKTVRGRLYGVAAVVVTIGGAPIEAVAVMADQEKWISAREDAVRWLSERGLGKAEAEKLVADGLKEEAERERREPALPGRVGDAVGLEPMLSVKVAEVSTELTEEILQYVSASESGRSPIWFQDIPQHQIRAVFEKQLASMLFLESEARKTKAWIRAHGDYPPYELVDGIFRVPMHPVTLNRLQSRMMLSPVRNACFLRLYWMMMVCPVLDRCSANWIDWVRKGPNMLPVGMPRA